MTAGDFDPDPDAIRMIVRTGYDQAADRYTDQRDQFSSHHHLDRLIARLRPGATVLDVGCGAGIPIDRYLVDRGYAVRGLDLSEQQIALARARVPEAEYEVRDMTGLAAGAYSVDAIVSFYAIFHTPRSGHAALFRTLYSFLPAGGLLLVTMGADSWEGIERDFHGVTMFWSHFDRDTNRRLIEDSGFTVLHDEIDDQQGERHQVVLAVRPTDRSAFV